MSRAKTLLRDPLVEFPIRSELFFQRSRLLRSVIIIIIIGAVISNPAEVSANLQITK